MFQLPMWFTLDSPVGRGRLTGKAEEVLASIPPFSAVFELYDWLRQYAEGEIKRAMHDDEDLE